MSAKKKPSAFSRIERSHARGVPPAVFLDFDGTLSPIVARPNSARLPKRTRILLERLAKRFPVAIISGRDLADIEARIGIDGIAYAGAHGLEWLLNGKRHAKQPGTREMQALASARRALLSIVPAFPGLVVEDKRRSFALNYRGLSPLYAEAFVEAAFAAIEPYRQRLRVLNELATFDVLPKVTWTKGQCALSMLNAFDRTGPHLPIYLGDSLTDEDAFRALRSGVTIRIGGGKTTANYRLPRASVDTFLRRVADLPTRS